MPDEQVLEQVRAAVDGGVAGREAVPAVDERRAGRGELLERLLRQLDEDAVVALGVPELPTVVLLGVVEHAVRRRRQQRGRPVVLDQDRYARKDDVRSVADQVDRVPGAIGRWAPELAHPEQWGLERDRDGRHI